MHIQPAGLTYSEVACQRCGEPTRGTTIDGNADRLDFHPWCLRAQIDEAQQETHDGRSRQGRT